MKYEFFVAARYRNRDAALELARSIRLAGRLVYCFAESRASLEHVGDLNSDPETVMKAFESNTDWTTSGAVQDVFTTDMEALENSATLILLLPAGKSAHIEAGVAYGLKKQCILIGTPERNESLYLIFDKQYPSIDSFIADLRPVTAAVK